MRKYLIISLVVLTTLMLTGCGKAKKENNEKKEENQNVTEEVMCEGCVFSIYSDAKKIGKKGDILPREIFSTTNYKDMKDGRKIQIPVFLGHKLDENSEILKGYVCQVIDNELLCLGQITDENTYNANSELLKKFYTEEECTTDSTYTTCSRKKDNDYYNVMINVSGVVKIQSGGKTCSIRPDGTMSC